MDREQNIPSKGEVVVPDAETKSSLLNPRSTSIPPSGSEGSITWTANEFISHRKGAMWYMALVVGALVLAGIVWLLTRDKITAGAIVVAAIMFAIFAAKKPRELECRIDKDGLNIGSRHFRFEQFRSFCVVHQGGVSSLALIPMKRFALLTSVYYDPQDEEKILSIISSYLPIEERKRDLIDDFLWRIRY